jgi:hypothetical protein
MRKGIAALIAMIAAISNVKRYDNERCWAAWRFRESDQVIAVT